MVLTMFYEDYEALISTAIVVATAGWVLVEVILWAVRKIAGRIHGSRSQAD